MNSQIISNLILEYCFKITSEMYYIAELTCEKHNNPADFYLDKIIKSEEQVKSAENATTEEGRGLA